MIRLSTVQCRYTDAVRLVHDNKSNFHHVGDLIHVIGCEASELVYKSGVEFHRSMQESASMIKAQFFYNVQNILVVDELPYDFILRSRPENLTNSVP